MNAEPVSRATTWLRASYWTGAISDGVMVVAMQNPCNIPEAQVFGRADNSPHGQPLATFETRRYNRGLRQRP